MFGTFSARHRSVHIIPAAAAGLCALGLAAAASADPLADLSVQSALTPVQGAVNDLTGTATSTVTGTTTATNVIGANTLAYFGGMNEGLRYTDAFFMERSTNPYIDDPARNSRKPVKMGFALFSTDAGDFEISLNYAGRFNGDFQEHHGGLRLTWKIPPN